MEAICDKKLCSGCAACANICVKNAIQMKPDERGFLCPEIDPELCVDCRLCANVCPQNTEAKNACEGKVFAALNKDDTTREKSSSGGVFTALAQWILKKQGVVFGAAYDDTLTVRHIWVDTLEGLEKLRGSKYVQSDVGTSYREVKTFLDSGRFVLFSGTPCQVAGLKNFLRKEYDKLITVDILCHGVPSNKVFKKFLNNEDDPVVDVMFRTKRCGWKRNVPAIKHESGRVGFNSEYYNLFLKDICLRESCYHCRFADAKHPGDITLGDYWGYKETSPEYIADDDRGISFVSINNAKGEKIFKKVKKGLALAKRTMEDAKHGNPILAGPMKRHPQNNEFWADFDVLSWDELMMKYNVKSGMEPDWMSKEDRDYFAIPYKKRQPIHKLRCVKNEVIRKLKKH